MVSTMLAASDLPWQELHGNLRAFIGRRVRNQADVDDLVQRVLLQIVKGLGSLRDAERLHAWVYRTARNVIVDHYRSSTARRELASGDAEDLAVADAPDLSVDDESISSGIGDLPDAHAAAASTRVSRGRHPHRPRRDHPGGGGRASGRVSLWYEEPRAARASPPEGGPGSLLPRGPRPSRQHRRVRTPRAGLVHAMWQL